MNHLEKEHEARLQTAVKDAQPCPFCGSTWILHGHRYSAICVDCGATGPEKEKVKDADKAWNRRAALAADPTSAEGIGKIREALLSCKRRWPHCEIGSHPKPEVVEFDAKKVAEALTILDGQKGDA